MAHSGQHYWLPPHVRACPTTTGAVLLDLNRNRYIAIGSDEARALFTLTGRATEPMPPETAARFAPGLLKAGLLSHEPNTDGPTTLGDIDLNSTLTSVGHQLNRSSPLRPSHIINFLRACAWSRRALRSRPLYSVACEISDSKRQSTQAFDKQRAIELVCIFRRLRPFAFTAKDQCLFHALALVKFLSFYQVFPAWVIGIRAKPWAAHSWVQQGTLLLDSNPEHICEYSPILVV